MSALDRNEPFAKKFRKAMMELYGSSDPAELVQPTMLSYDKLYGYLSGQFTPSLGTLGRLCAPLSDFKLAAMVRAAREEP